MNVIKPSLWGAVMGHVMPGQRSGVMLEDGRMTECDMRPERLHVHFIGSRYSDLWDKPRRLQAFS